MRWLHPAFSQALLPQGCSSRVIRELLVGAELRLDGILQISVQVKHPLQGRCWGRNGWTVCPWYGEECKWKKQRRAANGNILENLQWHFEKGLVVKCYRRMERENVSGLTVSEVLIPSLLGFLSSRSEQWYLCWPPKLMLQAGRWECFLLGVEGVEPTAGAVCVCPYCCHTLPNVPLDANLNNLKELLSPCLPP